MKWKHSEYRHETRRSKPTSNPSPPGRPLAFPSSSSHSALARKESLQNPTWPSDRSPTLAFWTWFLQTIHDEEKTSTISRPFFLRFHRRRYRHGYLRRFLCRRRQRHVVSSWMKRRSGENLDPGEPDVQNQRTAVRLWVLLRLKWYRCHSMMALWLTGCSGR